MQPSRRWPPPCLTPSCRSGAYKACAAFIRAARKAGYGGTFFNVSFVGTQALADELGKDATASWCRR